MLESRHYASRRCDAYNPPSRGRCFHPSTNQVVDNIDDLKMRGEVLVHATVRVGAGLHSHRNLLAPHLDWLCRERAPSWMLGGGSLARLLACWSRGRAAQQVSLGPESGSDRMFGSRIAMQAAASAVALSRIKLISGTYCQLPDQSHHTGKKETQTQSRL